jgi:outer membrane lipoprotein SlyB
MQHCNGGGWSLASSNYVSPHLPDIPAQRVARRSCNYVQFKAFIDQTVQQRRKPVKKSILAFAAAMLIVPGAAVVAADGFSLSNASAGYKADVANQNRNREYREWRGKDGRTYCRRKNGTTGLVIGAAAGGLAGNQIAGRGDKTVGTIIGAAGGALLGREIDKGKRRCR